MEEMSIYKPSAEKQVYTSSRAEVSLKLAEVGMGRGKHKEENEEMISSFKFPWVQW